MMSSCVGDHMHDEPVIWFRNDRAVISRWPRIEISLPVAWRTDPSEGFRWIRCQQRQPGYPYNLNGPIEVAGALILTGLATMREIEVECGISWSLMYRFETFGITWLGRLAKSHGMTIVAGQTKTTLTDLLMSDNAEIRAFAQTLVHQVPAGEMDKR